MNIVDILGKTFLVGDDTYRKITISNLISEYNALAKSWCAKYCQAKTEFEYEDMLQETTIAIMNAYSTYSLEFHVSIGYYLNICIRNTLNNYCKSTKHQISHKACKSLDGPSDGQIKDINYNRISDPHAVNNLNAVNNKVYVTQLFKNLQPTEIAVLQGIYMHDQTQESVASELNLSQVQVNRIKMKGFKKIKQFMQLDVMQPQLSY